MFSTKGVEKVIIINSGHWDDSKTPHLDDGGAQFQEYREYIECTHIRDVLVPMLIDRGYTVHAVPDDLDLRASITWANKIAPKLNDGLAIDIHLNALSNRDARGTEAFYGTSDTSKEIAAVLSANVAESLGIPDRGAKPDTQTAVGSLGWIRKTTMWASLIEVCFITNEDDMEALRGLSRGTDGYVDSATGIADAIDELYGVELVKVNPLASYTLPQLFKEISRRIMKLRA